MVEFVTNATLRVDPEFERLITPLTPDEFSFLRDNILSAGEVYEAIVVLADGTIIDGHHRWKIIQENPDIRWHTRVMEFPDRYAIIEWMCKNQLGRRNLSEEQRKYTIGKMYEARKNAQGGTGANQHTVVKEQTGQIDHSATRRQQRDGTAGEIGKDYGITSRSVRRAEKFAKGVDALRDVSPDAAEKVLAGNAGVSKSQIAKLALKPQDEIKDAADEILGIAPTPKPVPKPKEPKRSECYSSEIRGVRKMIDEAYKPMLDETAQSKYTVEDLAEEIIVNGADYTNYLNRVVAQRKDLLDNDTARNIAIAAINSVIETIEKVRESL